MSSSSSIFALAEAERIQLLVASVTDYAIYMVSPEGIVNSWNSGAQRFKGYTAEEIIGKHFSLFYISEDRLANLPARNLERALENGKFEEEGWRERKDGTRFWAHVVIAPIWDRAGHLVGFAKITRDITERKQAAEALHASEERFRLLVQGVTDYAIYMLSATGEITNWNAGARRIKGFEHDEVVGTHFSRFYTESDRARGLPAHALKTAETEGRFESEGWRLRKDGTKFWAHVVIDPIRNEMGSLIGFAKITRDITERREAAIALDKTREALFQSQKMEAIGKLTGGVAHDFNNLLSVVVSGLAILRNELPGENAMKVIDSMERAANRGATLTQQLLAFSRQQPLKQDRFNLNRVISAFEAVLRRANRGSIEFDLKLAPSLPLVLIDASQFEAAALNLIVNARDATPDGGSITLQTETVELRQNQIGRLAQGSYVKVTVSDTGAGMPPDVVARAIDPFFTTKPVGKGTGLGLSQVYGLVQQSNGELAIESAVGIGTAISLYFPALAAEHGELATASEGSDKALIVDDQEDVLEMAVELFRTLGFEVLSANNGEDALEIIKRMPDIDLLFTDVVMPGMSGIELGQKARVLAPNLKIILASGYAAPALKEDNAVLNDFQFVTKPYSISQIVKKLRVAG